MEVIEINTESIDLDQFLKWANAASSGGEAKYLIKNGEVSLNGRIETRRGKRVYRNDIVTIGNRQFKVV